MTRFLFWVALAFLVIAAIRAKLRSARRPPPPAASQRRQAAAEKAPAEAMLRCAHCGIHYPASETVLLNGRDYCSHAHAQLAAK